MCNKRNLHFRLYTDRNGMSVLINFSQVETVRPLGNDLTDLQFTSGKLLTVQKSFGEVELHCYQAQEE